MSTTVTVTITERRLDVLGAGAPLAQASIEVTRATKWHAIAEALVMVYAANRGEFERVVDEVRKGVRQLAPSKPAGEPTGGGQ